MPEHPIRLRGGWEIRHVGGPCGAVARIVLPTRWPDGPRRRHRLTRQFQRPRLDDNEEVVLRLERVPGVLSITINDQSLSGVGPPRAEYEIPLGPGSERYRLVLELEAPESPGAGAPSTTNEWGVISLIIRPVASSAP